MNELDLVNCARQYLDGVFVSDEEFILSLIRIITSHRFQMREISVWIAQKLVK